MTTSLVNHANSAVPSVLASLTKGGRDAATRSLAIDYAKRGIRVNAVAPGTIKTPRHSRAAFAQRDNLHPVGHMGEITYIVDSIFYLEWASFVTAKSCTSKAAKVRVTNAETRIWTTQICADPARRHQRHRARGSRLRR
jgi:NAD(P)-dependent dehydrogenase (short-subunit alcohol dehydrogenase family)